MVEEVTIETLGAQGDGVTAGGLFVPGTLPGERVLITPNGHRAIVAKLLVQAADRVAPVCAHFGQCGGCSLQHASDGLLAGWKRDLVHRAIASRGITGVEILPVLTSPPATRRRATFSGRRTKKGVLVGFHAPHSDEIIPLTECRIARREILRVLPALQELVTTGASRKGVMRFTVTLSQVGLDVSAEGGKPVEGPMYGQLVAVAATTDLARLCWDGEPVVVRRPPIQPMGRAMVVPPPGGFLQATVAAEAALVEAMRAVSDGADRVADLFAGSGTFTLPLAEKAEVLAVEADADAMAALDEGWRLAEGLKRVTTETRDLHHRPMLERELRGFGAVIFDPPRAGARPQATQLALSEVPRIGAISCNPATFARDARLLIDGGYRLDWIQPVDQFRWSPHVELAAQFSRI